MNVIILNGSPRRNGNTVHAMNAIKAGLEGRHTVETINTIDLKLKGCIACEACSKNGGNCVLPDGGAEFMNKIAAADLIIFGTPVYWWGISAQLKLALDKFYSKGNEFHRVKKKIGIVSIGGAELDDPEYRLISEQFHCIADFLGWEVVIDEKFMASDTGDLANNQTAIKTLTAIGQSL